MKTIRMAVIAAMAGLGVQAACAATNTDWRTLLDGTNLQGWKTSRFFRPGAIRCLPAEPPAAAPTNAPAGPAVYLGAGDDLTGITYTNAIPAMNYELRLEAMRVAGGDFFCGLTFPVGSNHCTFVVGGWGGMLVGISSIDGMDASENETGTTMEFANGRWYAIAVRVTPGRIEADIDGQRVVGVDVAGRRVSMRPGEIEESAPLGVACWRTPAAIRNIRIRNLPPPPAGNMAP